MVSGTLSQYWNLKSSCSMSHLSIMFLSFFLHSSTEHVSGSVVYHGSATQFSSQGTFARTRNKGDSVSMVSHMYTGDLSGILQTGIIEPPHWTSTDWRNIEMIDGAISVFRDWIWAVSQITFLYVPSCHSWEILGEVARQISQQKPRMHSDAW